MALYLISYDLIGKSFDQYETLIAELESLGAKRVLLSEWILRNNATSQAVRDHVRKFMHPNDRVLVTEISVSNWASSHALININDV